MAQLLTRRNFLKGLGVATIVVAGGIVWRAADGGVLSTGQGLAYEPWTNWRDTSNPQMNLIRSNSGFESAQFAAMAVSPDRSAD